MKKVFKIIASVLVVLILVLVIRTLIASGSFKSIVPHSKNPMTVIKGMVGAEDITIDRSLGKALVSADDRRMHRTEGATRSGIYLLDYKASPPSFNNLTENFPQTDFHPHGLSLYHDLADSTKWVFVVNHRENGHFIEVFKFTDSTLIHQESISDPAICSPNDVVGIGKREFYFTNDHDTGGGIDRWKDYLMIGTGQAGHYKDGQVEIFDRELGYSNGINVSQGGQFVVVANSTGRDVRFYKRGTHELVGTVDCNTGLDNIELDEQGHLWIGCHPKMLAFTAHAKKAEKRSPSQIIKIEINPNEVSQSTITEVYLNDGNPLSGSTVAAIDGNILLMGTVFEDGVGMLEWR
ncbi:MAG: hypothetical protein AAFZ15_20165 [Bacteroidota bacterium]